MPLVTAHRLASQPHPLGSPQQAPEEQAGLSLLTGRRQREAQRGARADPGSLSEKGPFSLQPPGPFFSRYSPGSHFARDNRGNRPPQPAAQPWANHR